MGLCFSKRRQQEKQPVPPLSAGTSAKSKKPGKAAAVAAADEQAKKTPQPKRAGEPDKKAVSVVKTKAATAVDARPLVVLPTAPVRTSSCTKEEVDAILIQCGRLSRSSSGTGMAGSGDTGGGHHRRRSGSKRSYDFDQEGDWEKHGVAAASRQSPHRSSPQRKRSGSRERTGGGGSRRASRSPGRRAEGASSAATASSGGASRQPGKMVSVPAREKGRAPSPAAAASAKRCASPRSSSPARLGAGNENPGGGQKTAGPTPALSRSSSRKAEQSPYRRSPMVELDENSLRNRNSNDAKPQKKSMEPQKASERAKEKQGIAERGPVAASEPRAPSSKSTATRTVSTNVVAEPHNPRSGSRSRRSSRDFDQNPNLYATQLLEDIQNYHNASAGTPPSFSLPACVSKACSIVEAVADLNSSSSETRTCEPARSADDKASVNAPRGGDGPSVHRYVSVRDIRGEAEPQESAGSNSVSGNLWTPSCDRNSVESTDRTWSTSRSNGDEVVQQGSHGGARSPLNRPRQSKQEHSGRSRAGSSGVNVNRAPRGSGSVASGRSGVRAV